MFFNTLDGLLIIICWTAVNGYNKETTNMFAVATNGVFMNQNIITITHLIIAVGYLWW